MSKRTKSSTSDLEITPSFPRKRTRRATLPSTSPEHSSEAVNFSELAIQRPFYLDAEFFLSTSFTWVEKLKSLEIWDLFTFSESVYPSLIREFYANASVSESEPSTVRSEVKGKRILVNTSILYRVFSISPLYINTNPSKFSQISDQFYAKYSHCKPSTKKNFSYTSLKSEARALCYCLMRMVFPFAPSKENPNNTALKVLYDILEGFDIDVFPFIINQMEDTIKEPKAHPLPFPMLLTKIFHLFKVELDSEDSESEPPVVMNKDELEFLGFVEQSSGSWVHSSELVEIPASSSTQPPQMPSSVPSSDQIAPLLSALNSLPSQIKSSLDSVSSMLTNLGTSLKEEILGELEESMSQRVSDRVKGLIESTFHKCEERLGAVVEQAVTRAIAKAQASEGRKADSDLPQKKTTSAPAARPQPTTSTSSKPKLQPSSEPSPAPLNVEPLRVVHPEKEF